MEYRKLQDLRAVAEIVDAPTITQMSRAERLRRWADLLREHGGGVRPLFETEFVAAALRRGLRENGSALTVAFADPVLRAAGLRGDTYGAVQDFFELSHDEMHWILCHCNGAAAESAGIISRRIEDVAAHGLGSAAAVLWLLAPAAACAAGYLAML
jgi:hypothetical protein